MLARQIVRSVALVMVLLSLLTGVVVGSFVAFRRHRQNLCGWILRLHCRMILKILGLRVVRDPYAPSLSSKPTLFLSNHVSYVDILVIASQWRLGFLAKSEVSAWPFVGRIAQSCGTIFVKRSSLFSRAMCIEKISERLSQGHSMLVFPEGTTSIEGPRKKWRPFFSGAVSAATWAGADLKLLYLDYQNVEDVAWLGDDSLLPNLWKILSRPNTRVRIRESRYTLQASGSETNGRRATLCDFFAAVQFRIREL